jgi:hypothetical protein
MLVLCTGFCLPIKTVYVECPEAESGVRLASVFRWSYCSLDKLPGRLAQHNLPAVDITDVAGVTLQLLCSMAQSEYSGLAHLDLKPENVYIDPCYVCVGGSDASSKLFLLAVRVGDLDAGARHKDRVPATTGTEPYRLYADSGLEGERDGGGNIEVTAHWDWYTVCCHLLPMLLQLAGPASPAESAGAAAFRSLIQRLQNQPLDKLQTWVRPATAAMVCQRILTYCGSKGQAYVKRTRAGFTGVCRIPSWHDIADGMQLAQPRVQDLSN